MSESEHPQRRLSVNAAPPREGLAVRAPLLLVTSGSRVLLALVDEAALKLLAATAPAVLIAALGHWTGVAGLLGDRLARLGRHPDLVLAGGIVLLGLALAARARTRAEEGDRSDRGCASRGRRETAEPSSAVLGVA